MPDDSESGKAPENKQEGTPPAFVPADEYKRTVDLLSAGMGEIREGLAVMRAEAAARGKADPVLEALPAEPTEDEYAAAQGDPKLMRELFTRLRQIDLKRLERERLGPLEAQGTEALANLTKAQVLGTKPHYARFKKDIDATLNTMPANVRMRPEVMDFVYNSVIGQNLDALQKEDRERVLRGDAQQGDAPSGDRGNPKKGNDAVPSVSELLGEDAALALRNKGIDADAMSRRLGYKTWADYAKVIQAQDNPDVKESS